MEKILTIVVPAYNVERYLEKCLLSFIEETLLQQLEVIVVNDGSTDRTEEIANRFASKYPQTFKVISKENGGHGSGINTAAEQACGKYFKVIDADDWIITENLVKLNNILQTADVDALITPFDMIHMKTGQVISFPLNCECGRVYTLEELINVYKDVYLCCSFHGIFYRTDTYKKVDFKLSEKIFYEDNEYATVPFIAVEKIFPVNLVVYQYQVGDDGQSVAFGNQVKRIAHIQKVIERIIDFKYTRVKCETATETYFLLKLKAVVVSYYATALIKNHNKNEGRNMAADFRKYLAIKDIQLKNSCDKKYKVLVLLSYLHVSPFFYQKLMESVLYRTIKRVWMRPSK